MMKKHHVKKKAGRPRIHKDGYRPLTVAFDEEMIKGVKAIQDKIESTVGFRPSRMQVVRNLITKGQI